MQWNEKYIVFIAIGRRVTRAGLGRVLEIEPYQRCPHMRPAYKFVANTHALSLFTFLVWEIASPADSGTSADQPLSAKWPAGCFYFCPLGSLVEKLHHVMERLFVQCFRFMWVYVCVCAYPLLFTQQHTMCGASTSLITLCFPAWQILPREIV